MRRSNSRSGITRSNSTRSIGSNADNNAQRSAAAAAASALAAAQRRSSIDVNTARPSTAPGALQRRGSVGSISSVVTSASNRPGQYSAVRQTGARRLYGNAATGAASIASTSKTPTKQAPVTQSTQLRETMRSSKPPTTASTQRRQQNVSSSASIRSFQSDLERINEDYNKTYAYTGQTSANAMRLNAPASARGRRADSVASSVVSDTSESPAYDAQRKKASRVSFSDVDENEGRSRGPSPNPERRRSALKNTSPATVKINGIYTANGPDGAGRGASAASGLMPPPALIRRASNSSLHSNTSAAGLGNVPVLAAPLQKTTQQVPSQSGKADDGDLSTIGETNSAYSDADEDFKASPALKRQKATTEQAGTAPNVPLQLTQHNLAAATGTSPSSRSPTKSALKPTTSQTGSAARYRLDTDSQLDVADDESDDSFAARRRAKKVNGRKSITTLRVTDATNGTSKVTKLEGAQSNAPLSQPSTRVVRSSSVSSQQSRTSQGPSRMVSLRQAQPNSSKRQSLQGSRASSHDNIPAMVRRSSLQSLQPPVPPKSIRRASVAGSVDGSYRDEAVSNHVNVYEIAQRNIQQLLRPGAAKVVEDTSLAAFADAPERKRSSFERRRPSTLSRQNSSSSMISRTLRNPTTAPEPPAPEKTHKRAASDDRAFATTLRPPRPIGQRSSSMIITNAEPDMQSPAGTPKKSGLRRMSLQFRRTKTGTDEAPPVPAMRRYSSDSEIALPVGRKDAGTSLSAGTSRSGAPAGARNASDVSYSKKTGKPKKFQALRRLLKIN